MIRRNETVSFYTLGCKLNQYETEGMREAFRKRGIRIVPFGEPSDICVVHTCTVTQRTDYQCRQALRRAARVCKDGLVVATGCYAQTNPNSLAQIEGVGLVVGTAGKTELPDLIERVLDGGPKIAIGPREELRRFAEWDVRGLSEHTRALLKIQDGCDRFCSYCIVPFARGPSRSRVLENVLREAKFLVEAGYREIVLTGVNVGDYGRDLEPRCDLAALLRRLLSVCGPNRIRLNSLEPLTLTDEIVELMAGDPRLAPHVQVPLQSGSPTILRAMRRNYRLEQYRDALDRLRGAVPDVGLGADVIVGFPGE
ncbi:MAG: MiaB/RimO family radical SAM methylthiotransferase, partial [Candidatus Latescibacteria bacterium]|nr:MiaB/RimO family radical SAM methylthiotransferase [Candidatus Latescibacterota bacterium]